MGDGVTLYTGVVVAANGSVTTPAEHDYVIGGLPYTGLLITNSIEAGSRIGTAQALKKRISKLFISVIRSYLGLYGSSEGRMYNLTYRNFVAGTLYTGRLVQDFDSTASEEEKIVIKQDKPYPLNINAIIYQGETQE
jgi:hypothetical protein